MKNDTPRKIINVDKPNLMPLWTLKQDDDVTLKLSLFKESIPFNITGQKIRLGAKTLKGLKEQIDGFTIKENDLDIALKNTILVPGIVEIDLEFTDAEGKMTSASFFINVNSKVLNDAAVQATNEFDTFKRTVEEVEKDYQGLRKIIIDENNAANLQDQVNKVNSSLEQKAKQVDLIVERERINNLVKISSGEIDNVEISDARVGADGKIYNTIGEASRNQFYKVFSDSLFDDDKNYNSLWEQGGIHSSGVENIVVANTIRTKNFISDFDKLELTSNDYVIGIALFNNDLTAKKWITNLGNISSTLKVINKTELQTIDINKIIETFKNEYFKVKLVMQKSDASSILPSEFNVLKIIKTEKPLQMQINETFQYVSNGKKLIASAITDKGIITSNEDTFEVMANNIKNIETKTNDKLLYNFGVISDNHCAMAYNGQDKMVMALNSYKNLGVDFLISCGDITTDNLEHLQWLRNKINEIGFNIPFYSVRGNHDNLITDEQWIQYIGHSPNYTFTKGNDMFIFLSIDNDLSNAYNYNNSWDYLQTLDVSNKRVFLIQHLSWEGKAGVRDGEAYGFTKDHVIGNNIYNYFNNMIAFTGHSHYTFECEDTLPKHDINVWQDIRKNKTVIHCPSTGYAVDKDRNKITSEDIVQGWICEVYDKKVVLRGVDLKTGNYMSDFTYIINTI